MRRRTVVAMAALIAAFALAGLPVPAGSQTPTPARDLAPAAFTSVVIPATAPAHGAWGESDGALDPAPALDSAGALDEASVLSEPGKQPKAPAARPSVEQPAAVSGKAWKKPKYTITGIATFYDNGTTAMRLPRGTIVRICGDGGCIERTVNDYGPQMKSRVVDLYTPDFFEICGCGSWSGTTRVTVSVY